ncbi:MAG: prepilin-type N-terminal cleavage/methylation domain-containing protein [Candidatus Omnitrophica bacterium]|nr:prepilin-type N-terminal cleavage/methylation domain-containing protein [Candidatus Omnitrophota bacterium]
MKAKKRRGHVDVERDMRLHSRGFSLTELILVIVILAIIAAVAIPKMGEIAENARISATEKEMMELVRAIIGDPETGFQGYLDDIGSLPTQLSNLYSSSGESPYNPFTKTGWNGPYIDQRKRDILGDGGELELDILYDAWDQPYVPDFVGSPSTITSDGPDKTSSTADDIVVKVGE